MEVSDRSSTEDSGRSPIEDSDLYSTVESIFSLKEDFDGSPTEDFEVPLVEESKLSPSEAFDPAALFVLPATVTVF